MVRADDGSSGGARTNSEVGSVPPLRRRTISSVVTAMPLPASPTIATVPPATSGLITSITLIPVSRIRSGPAARRASPDSSVTICPRLSRFTGVALWRPELSTVAPRERAERRQRDAAHDAAARTLHHLHGDGAALRLVAHRKLAQQVRQR